MQRKSTYTIEEKIRATEDYINGVRGRGQICLDLGGISPTTIRKWASIYKKYGISAFEHKKRNSSYTKDFKIKVIKEYMKGKGSLEDLALKYNLSQGLLSSWVKKYNSNIELKDYNPKPEVYMATAGRKTTKEERIEIVTHCIYCNRDYSGIAEKYAVSYNQVYTWVKKYDANGENGLGDRRGHRKIDENVDELEKLHRENKLLKKQLEEAKFTVELLKKVKEFEGRRYSPKGN